MNRNNYGVMRKVCFIALFVAICVVFSVLVLTWRPSEDDEDFPIRVWPEISESEAWKLDYYGLAAHEVILEYVSTKKYGDTLYNVQLHFRIEDIINFGNGTVQYKYRDEYVTVSQWRHLERKLFDFKYGSILWVDITFSDGKTERILLNVEGYYHQELIHPKGYIWIKN